MAITGGPNLNVVPAPQQAALSTNYLDLNGAGGWGQQYVPDLMEKEAEVFGPRTISGFLSQVGAEEAMTADQVIWSEQGRLHLSYKANVTAFNGGLNYNPGGGAIGAVSSITLTQDIDGNAVGSGGATADHGVRLNDTVIVADATNGVVKALVVKVADNVIDVAPYTANTLTGNTTGNATTVLVYGSEYGKGVSYYASAGATTQTDSRGSNEPDFKTFSNKPIILKDYYEVSGSDASRVGWVEVTSEMGDTGYLWYLKAESDTRARFTDYLEMSMLEAVKDGTSLADASANMTGTPIGTQGLFDAIEDRGNTVSYTHLTLPTKA